MCCYFRIADFDLTQVWSLANATANMDLIEACLPLIQEQIDDLITNEAFIRGTEIDGMRSLIACMRGSGLEEDVKLNAITSWINAPTSVSDRSDREECFEDFLPLLDVEMFSRNLIIQLASGKIAVGLPTSCR